MRLNKQVQTQLENYAKDYANLENLTGENYDKAWNDIVSKYNLLLDSNLVAKGVLDELDFSDLSSVKNRMILNAKRDRKYNRLNYWANAAPNLLQAGIDALPDLISGIMDNDYSNALASFTPSVKPEMNPIDLSIKLDGKRLAVPGQLPSSKHGGQINYISLFK